MDFMGNDMCNNTMEDSCQNAMLRDGLSISIPVDSNLFSFQNQCYGGPVLTGLHNCFQQLPGPSPFSLIREMTDVVFDGHPDPKNLPAALAVTSTLTNGGQEDARIMSAPDAPLNAFRSYSHVNYCLGVSNDGIDGSSRKWDLDKFPSPFVDEEYVKRNGCETSLLVKPGYVQYPGMVASSQIERGFSCEFSNLNELSLSLSTSQHGNPSGVSDQCSGALINTVGKLNSDQISSGSTSRELSLNFSQIKHGWKYIEVIQEILAQIASYSLKKSGWAVDGMTTTRPSDQNECYRPNQAIEVEHESVFRCRRSLEAKKENLLALLQVVDDRYSHCVDEIHTVVSAFHAATELDQQLHARYALQTVCFFYKNLRERISSHILALGSCLEPRGKEKAFESSFLKRQWAIQQLKRKNSQLWRPQRGLPEKSVSVLRAWMFQNFLHPYPKDAEKHLLAIKSGLTRSQVFISKVHISYPLALRILSGLLKVSYQVSNWFINARVRLWKPMIEEMYADVSRRKAQLCDGGNEEHGGEIDSSQLVSGLADRDGGLIEMYRDYGGR